VCRRIYFLFLSTCTFVVVEKMFILDCVCHQFWFTRSNIFGGWLYFAVFNSMGEGLLKLMWEIHDTIFFVIFFKFSRRCIGVAKNLDFVLKSPRHLFQNFQIEGRETRFRFYWENFLRIHDRAKWFFIWAFFHLFCFKSLLCFSLKKFRCVLRFP